MPATGVWVETELAEDSESILNQTRKWLEEAVIGLGLCPFAARPWQDGRVELSVSHAQNEQAILADLAEAMLALRDNPNCETTLLILSSQLADFAEFNAFLGLADEFIEAAGFAGEFQLASFHPQYCFSGNAAEDRSNWTNRSPFPVLHVIRESSISAAVASHPDIDSIPLRNIELLRAMGDAQFQRIFRHAQSERD